MRHKPAGTKRRQLQSTDALNVQVRAMSDEIEARRLLLDLQFNRLALLTEISLARADQSTVCAEKPKGPQAENVRGTST